MKQINWKRALLVAMVPIYALIVLASTTSGSPDSDLSLYVLYFVAPLVPLFIYLDAIRLRKKGAFIDPGKIGAWFASIAFINLILSGGVIHFWAYTALLVLTYLIIRHRMTKKLSSEIAPPPAQKVSKVIFFILFGIMVFVSILGILLGLFFGGFNKPM